MLNKSVLRQGLYSRFGRSMTTSKPPILKNESPVLKGIKLKSEASLCADNFDFKNALVKSMEAHEITLQHFGPHHTYTAETLMKTAEYYTILGYFGKAMTDAQQAVDILNEHATTHKPSLASALSVQSKALANGGLYLQALNVETAAFQLKREMFGELNIQTFISQCELGERHRLVGDLNTANKLLAKCLKIAEETFKNDELLFEKYMLELILAQLNIHQEHFIQAHHHIDRMIEGMKDAHIPNHQSLLTGKMYNVLGEIELHKKKKCPRSHIDDDNDVVFEALQISKNFYDRVFEGKHPDFAMTLTIMARNYFDKGYPDQARTIQEDAIKMFNHFISDVTHPQYLIMNLILANIMRQSHDKYGAQLLAEKTFSQLENKLGKNHPQCIAYARIISNYQGDMTGVM